MYFVEWLMRRTLTASKKDITGFEGDIKQFEKATEKYGKQYRGMQERQVSDAPSDARSICKMNDTYMDVSSSPTGQVHRFREQAIQYHLLNRSNHYFNSLQRTSRGPLLFLSLPPSATVAAERD
jgi:hypothetical protein